MPIKPWKYLVILLAVQQLEANAQLQTVRYPVRFSQYYSCYQLTNPAAVASNNDLVGFSAGDKHAMGNFSKISTYYIHSAMHLTRYRNNSNSSFSTIGMLLYNDREGKYLNRSRYYLEYSWHGNLTKNLKFSGGFHIGGMNYSVKGTPLSGDGSDTSPDGDIGIWLYNKKFHLGASYNQIFNSKIQPLDEVAILESYLNMDGSYTFYLLENLAFSPSYSFRIPLKDNNYAFDYSLLVGYNERIAIVVGVHETNMMINSIEIRKVFSDSFPLNLNITYGYPLFRKAINTNFIEFGLSFSIGNRG